MAHDIALRLYGAKTVVPTSVSSWLPPTHARSITASSYRVRSRVARRQFRREAGAWRYEEDVDVVLLKLTPGAYWVENSSDTRDWFRMGDGGGH